MYRGRVWTSTTANLLNSMSESPKLFSKFSTPYLVIQGGLDKIVNPFTVFDF